VSIIAIIHGGRSTNAVIPTKGKHLQTQQMQGCKDAGMQGCRDAWMQGCRDAEMHGCKCGGQPAAKIRGGRLVGGAACGNCN